MVVFFCQCLYARFFPPFLRIKEKNLMWNSSKLLECDLGYETPFETADEKKTHRTDKPYVDCFFLLVCSFLLLLLLLLLMEVGVVVLLRRLSAGPFHRYVSVFVYVCVCIYQIIYNACLDFHPWFHVCAHTLSTSVSFPRTFICYYYCHRLLYFPMHVVVNDVVNRQK